ncbi:hypothetical protein [Spirosoma sp. KNUC1025]|uniref:hypothetical protein n=1 Tax=Spirosoma sp. KNUC1025 TaxID=2894082 RepID=UPI001E40C722|nr:hypothetical protein [Spirosoma sp. KNUC1025]UFH57804.1 hypothetical protein LN737_32830 [Spirosoma sp. KNUC1025]
MIHPLDNPVWSALTSGNQSVALGNDQSKYYPPQVAPFVAVADNTRVHFEVLRDTIPYEQPVALFTHEPQLDPSPWVLVNRIDGFQMLYEGPTPAEQDSLIDLTEANVPQMLALTTLSPPGPFLPGRLSWAAIRAFLPAINWWLWRVVGLIMVRMWKLALSVRTRTIPARATPGG